MNPLQKNKVDISSLSEEEQKLFRLYGKLPNKKDLLQNKLKERKYFDSGDYALSKAGKASEGGVTTVGQMHPQPENIPHLTSPGPGGSNNNNANSGPGSNGSTIGTIPGATSGSPVKESSFLNRETSADDPDVMNPAQSPEQSGISPPPQKPGVPIRWQQ